MEGSMKGSYNKLLLSTASGIGIVFLGFVTITLLSGFSAATLTETTSNRFGPGLSPTNIAPPEIVLINDGVKYEGQLFGSTFSRLFESFRKLPDIRTGNITAVSPDNIVSVNQGSQIQFAIEGNPRIEAQFDSMSVTAYTEDGRPVDVLGMLTGNDSTEGRPPVLSFSVSKLQPGMQYILLSSATWLDYPDSEAISGYVYYVHRINIEA
jgi:hypothetical protein